MFEPRNLNNEDLFQLNRKMEIKHIFPHRRNVSLHFHLKNLLHGLLCFALQNRSLKLLQSGKYRQTKVMNSRLWVAVHVKIRLFSSICNFLSRYFAQLSSCFIQVSRCFLQEYRYTKNSSRLSLYFLNISIYSQKHLDASNNYLDTSQEHLDASHNSLDTYQKYLRYL